MDLTDAVGGSFRAVIRRFFKLYLKSAMDDTEYVQNIRVVVEAAEDFTSQNRDTLSTSCNLPDGLQALAKDLWMTHTLAQQETTGNPGAVSHEENICGYYDYYYDFIYAHDAYPD